jgi:nucleotide-binding universal stress UspA family protein
LIELAAAIARYENGRTIPLAIALAQPQMDSPQLSRALAQSRQRLEVAQAISEEFTTSPELRLRIEYNVAQAICHVSREENANLIVLGMHQRSKLGVQLFNTIQDDVLWAAHCPVVVARLLESPTTFKTILLPIENPSVDILRVLRFAQVLATVNQAKVTLLHVCSSRTSTIRQNRLRKQLDLILNRLPAADWSIETQVLRSDIVITTILKVAHNYDLVILRSQCRRVGSGFTLGKSTSPLLNRLNGSVLLIGEPHRQQVQRPLRRLKKAASA